MADSEEFRAINRRIDSIIQTTNVASGSTTMENGDSVTFNITTTSTSGAKIVAQVDFSFFAGAIDADHEIPFGSSVTGSEWQIIGPWSSWADTDNLNTVTRVYIRNISAGSTLVTVKATSRIIVNSPTLGGDS